MRRATDNRVAPEQPACLGWGEILLPDMNAGGTSHSRQVGPIVDEHARPDRRGDPDEGIAQLEKRPRREPLGPDLKETCTAVEVRACEIDRRQIGTERHVDIDDGLKGWQ